MHSVKSADGTTIAFERGGTGPHLVLVHGTSASRARWGNLRPLLEPHFTVTAMDRRGRGGSGDTARPYDIQREYEDVAAVAASCEGQVILFGHSYGALCALGALPLIDNLAALILYEAPVLEGNGPPEELLARLEAALDRGDREQVITLFCLEVVRMRPSDFAALHGSPVWPARLAAAHTLPRELRAAAAATLAAARPEGITVPTLLLHGGDSPDFFKVPMARIAAAIPSGTAIALDGQQHVAMDTAPQLLTDVVIRFWNDTNGR